MPISRYHQHSSACEYKAHSTFQLLHLNWDVTFKGMINEEDIDGNVETSSQNSIAKGNLEQPHCS